MMALAGVLLCVTVFCSLEDSLGNREHGFLCLPVPSVRLFWLTVAS